VGSVVEGVRNAIERRVLVEFERAVIEPRGSSCHGYIHDASPELVLVQLLSDRLDLDGYCILRVADITRLALEYPRQVFYGRALSAKAIAGEAPARVDLSSVAAAFRSIEASYPLFVVHRELEDPEVCEVGRLKFCSQESYALRTISPEARWVDDARHYSFPSVTRIDFDGEYENTLALVAGLAG